MGSSISPLSVAIFAIGSSTFASPEYIHVTLPLTPLGTIILWSTASVSCTVPSTSPALTSSPTFATGTKFQSFSWSMAFTLMPRFILSPACSRITFRGRCMPSYIDSISPGASSTLSGAPVDSTGSPGPMPPVSSYTCMLARSERSSITSPISFFSLTRTTSYICTSAMPSATIRGPDTFTMVPFIAICRSLSIK